MLSCSNTTFLFDVEISEPGDFEFEWIGPSGPIISDTVDAIVDEPGNYTLTVTFLGNGCSVVIVASVLFDETIPTLIVDLQQPSTCEDSILLDPRIYIALDTMCTYAWQAQDGLSTGLNNPILAILSITDTYTLVKMDTLNGCEQYFLFSAIVDGGLIADAGSDVTLACFGNIGTEIGGPSTTLGVDITYSWTVSSGGSIFGPTDQPTAIPERAGVYTLEVTNQSTGCIDIDVVVVNEASIPELAFTIGGGTCFGTTVILTALASTMGTEYTYEWFTEQGEFISSEEMIRVERCETYILAVTDIASGCIASSSIMVECVIPLGIELVITAEGNILAEVIGGYAPYTYDWNVNVDGSLVVNPEVGFTYFVTVTDAAGCIQSAMLDFIKDAVDRSSSQQLNLYPNPSQGVVTIELENIAKSLKQFQIIDVQGRDVTHNITFTDQHTMQLSLDQFVSGTYIIHAIAQDQLFYQKLVVID